MKSDLERRLRVLESERPACPCCEYTRAKLDSFTESQLRALRAVLMDEKDRRESRDPLPREISDEDAAVLRDFFENMPDLNPECPKCRADLEDKDEAIN